MTRATDGLPQHHLGDQLLRIIDELAEKFHGVFSRQTVNRFVHETYDLLDAQATVTLHLPSLTARFAKQRLTDYGHAQGLTRVTVPHVLFICVHNVGRSQIAAALLEHHAFGKVAVRSAGSHPQGDIPPTITQALAELGVSLTEAYPKPLTDEVVRAADVVVTMGCGDACPDLPGQAVSRLECRRPGRRTARRGLPDPRRHRPPHSRPGVRPVDRLRVDHDRLAAIDPVTARSP